MSNAGKARTLQLTLLEKQRGASSHDQAAAAATTAVYSELSSIRQLG